MKPHLTIRTRDVTRELEACSRALLAADEAHLREALESVHWERRGWLGRLVHLERPAEQIERREERLVA